MQFKKWTASVAVPLLFLVALPLSGGLRGPGKYSGVVFFDRWDTCVLVSGVYLTYISNDLKEGFRQYAGQAVQVDATRVYQPMNPGDARIKTYNWIGPAPEPQHLKVPGLELSARDDTSQKNSVILEIKNTGDTVLRLNAEGIGVHVFGNVKYDSNPSDGLSTAVLTRSTLGRPGHMGFLAGDTWHEGTFRVTTQIPQPITIKPGGSYKVGVTFILTPGEYDAVFGFGGGVHEEASLLSNDVPFTVMPGEKK